MINLLAQMKGFYIEQTISNKIEKKNLDLKDLINVKIKEIGKNHKLKDFTKKSSFKF
jgi:hypothetical protein